MGKISRKKTFDGKTTDDKQQRKISSFFENKSANKEGTSKLFTSIAESKKPVTTGSTCSHGEKPSFPTKPWAATKAVSKPGNTSMAFMDDSDVICIDEDPDGSEKVKGHDNEGRQTTGVGGEDKTVSVTRNNFDKQKDFATERSKDVKSGTYVLKERDSTLPWNPDDNMSVTPSRRTDNAKSAFSPDVICNTPNVDNGVGGTRRFKRAAGGRSFLRPFHLVSKQPDLKPAEVRLNANRKSKGIGLVSVCLNSGAASKSEDTADRDGNTPSYQSHMLNCSRVIHGEGKGCQSKKYIDNLKTIDNIPMPKRSCLDDNAGSQDRSVENRQFVCLLPKHSPESVEELRDGSGQDDCSEMDPLTVSSICVEDNKGERTGSRVVNKSTPTKVYQQSELCGTIKVKRLAKPGLSPASKRVMGPRSEAGTTTNVYNLGLEKARRHLDLTPGSELTGIGVMADVDLSLPLPIVTNASLDKPVPLVQDGEGTGVTMLSDNEYGSKLLSVGNCSRKCHQQNTHASLGQQSSKASKKFTVKKAEALGWKGVAKHECKKVKATLDDDRVLDELMLGLGSSPVNGRSDVKSGKNQKPCKKMKSTRSLDSKEGEQLVNSSNVSVVNDDMLQSFGMELPQQMGDIATSSPPSSVGSGEKSSATSGCSLVSNQIHQDKRTAGRQASPVTTKGGEADHSGLLDDSDQDSIMLAALGDVMDKEFKSKPNEDLASSFGDLSPFKEPKGRATTNETPPSSKREFRFSDLWQRFKVTEAIYDGVSDEKILGLLADSGPSPGLYSCTLRGFWVDTKVTEGDVVNVIGQFDDKNRCAIDDESGLLVVSPDLLLSGTSVVSSVFCARKSVLNEKFKGLDQGNAHMLYGSVIHSLFQAVVKDNVRDPGDVIPLAKSLLAGPKFLHAMYTLGVTQTSVLEEITQYIPPLMSWLDKHLARPWTDGDTSPSHRQTPHVTVTDIQDIEENIWSPRLGVKGKIDLTVKALIPDGAGLVQAKVVPLELKTGRASFSPEHKGQVTLYSMMYGDRRDSPGEGLLLYLKTGQMETVDVKSRATAGLIQLRNNLASHFKDQVNQRLDEAGHVTYSLGHLPQSINNRRACEKCAHLMNCCLYQRSVESSVPAPPPTHPMASLVPETLDHLDLGDLTYFSHWVTCLQMEEQEVSQRHPGPIWNMGSEERERKGDCLSHLSVESSELGVQESQGYNEGKGCTLTFVRHSHYRSNGPLDNVGLGVNDAVVVSSEDGRLIALATGFIRTLSGTHVEVIVDRDNLYDITIYKDILFRLDRNTSFSTSGQLMSNLTRLMENSTHASRLRQLIIHKHKPQSQMKIPMAWVRTMKPVFKDLNKPQKTAILKVLMATDYTVIRGFPGTGKTSTIVALVKVLHLLGKSVLLTSYTHSAVDNILLRLRGDNLPFLRLGRQAKVHPAIRPHTAEVLTTGIRSVEELKKFYQSYPVVAVSSLGVSHSLFHHRRFDVCVVDEASQVLQPACLGPILHAHQFVLVGDSRQLAPVVQSKGARSLKMDESLFLRLEEAGATFDLHLQYRMNKVVMSVSNRLVYKGGLACANPEVARQCLALELSHLEKCPDWVKAALDPDLSKSVMFVDTQKAFSASPNSGHGGTHNELEACLVISLLQASHKASVSTEDMGVISPYRSQVKLLQRKAKCCPLVGGVEVNTVDQYQGRDKSLIVVSFGLAESTPMGTAGELLTDVRRLNVAVTRARHKLILVGNADTLAAWPHLQNVIKDLQAAQCMVQIPPGTLPPTG